MRSSTCDNNHTAGIILHGKNWAFVPESGKGQGYPFFHSYSTTVKNSKYINRKDRSKLSMFAEDEIPYIGHPKYSTHKFLDLTDTFGKFSGYKLTCKTQQLS